MLGSCDQQQPKSGRRISGRWLGCLLWFGLALATLAAAQAADPDRQFAGGPSPGAAARAAPSAPGALQPLASVFDRRDIMARAAGVALLKVQAGQGRYYPCTGFLVESRLLLTNYHCIKDQADCQATRITFGYWRDENGKLLDGETFACGQFLGGAHALDFALVSVAGLADGQSKWPWLPLAALGGQSLGRSQPALYFATPGRRGDANLRPAFRLGIWRPADGGNGRLFLRRGPEPGRQG